MSLDHKQFRTLFNNELNRVLSILYKFYCNNESVMLVPGFSTLET